MKHWIATEISLDGEQDIKITPTPEFDGIQVSFKESGESKYSNPVYLIPEDLNIFIEKMQEMMDYSTIK